MKKSTVIVIILNILMLFSLPLVCSEKTETDGFLRLHVRAESDLVSDQVLKLQVRDTVLKTTEKLLSGCKTKEEAIKTVKENIPYITKKAENTVRKNGYSYPVTVEIKKEFFPYREYDGFFLPADLYDSITVKIGEGKGHNWWCVVFPAVCISGSSKFEEESVSKDEDGAVVTSSEVDLSPVPEKFRLAESPVPENVRYDFLIVKLFRRLFGIE